MENLISVSAAVLNFGILFLKILNLRVVLASKSSKNNLFLLNIDCFFDVLYSSTADYVHSPCLVFFVCLFVFSLCVYVCIFLFKVARTNLYARLLCFESRFPAGTI